jgi:hypothetical protein
MREGVRTQRTVFTQFYGLRSYSRRPGMSRALSSEGLYFPLHTEAGALSANTKFYVSLTHVYAIRWENSATVRVAPLRFDRELSQRVRFYQANALVARSNPFPQQESRHE